MAFQDMEEQQPEVMKIADGNGMFQSEVCLSVF
jgi:hypothetical protein